MKKQTISNLKIKGSTLYYELRSLGLNHSAALAAIIEVVISDVSLERGSPASKVASSTQETTSKKKK